MDDIKEENLNSKAELKSTTKKQETKFKLKDLIDSCEVLGYKNYVVAGAFFNVDLNSELTKKEFDLKVKEFLNRKAV